jgi:hypothetical protein
MTLYSKLEEAENNFLCILEEMGGRLRPQDDVVIHLTVSLSVVKVLLGKHQEAEMVFRRALNCVEQDLDDWDEA